MNGIESWGLFRERVRESDRDRVRVRVKERELLSFFQPDGRIWIIRGNYRGRAWQRGLVRQVGDRESKVAFTHPSCVCLYQVSLSACTLWTLQQVYRFELILHLLL